MSRRVVVFGSHSGLSIWGPALSKIPDVDARFVQHGSSGASGSVLSLVDSFRRARSASKGADAVVAVSTLLGVCIAAAQRRTPVIAIDAGAARLAETHRRLGRGPIVLALGLPNTMIGVTRAHGAALAAIRPTTKVQVVTQPIRQPPSTWVPDRRDPYVLSVGSSGRDLHSLSVAARSLPFDIRIVEGGRELIRSSGTPVSEPLPPNVTRYGRVSRGEYFRLLAGAAALVLPLHYSAYPIGITVMLDAMAAGVPVVATAVPSVTEYQREGTAFTVPIRDPAALADALRIAVDDRGRAMQVAEAGRRHAERIAAPEVVAARFSAVLAGLS